jgi:hypothetical protein
MVLQGKAAMRATSLLAMKLCQGLMRWLYTAARQGPMLCHIRRCHSSVAL